MKKLFRLILAVLAVIILLNAGILWLVSNFNMGLAAATALGFALLIYAILFDFINRLLDNRVGLVLKTLLVIAAAIGIFVSSLITVAGRTDTVTYKEAAVIVLGAGLHGEEPSRILCYRLDTALQYHKANPDALIVVSGGRGAQESITEALAMERYLIARGVNPEKIVREEQSTSTYENFLYSKELLDSLLPAGYKAAYITNSFHVFRAGRVAKAAGLSAGRMHAENDGLTLLPDYLRECCAVPVYWLAGK